MSDRIGATTGRFAGHAARASLLTEPCRVGANGNGGYSARFLLRRRNGNCTR
jgi:hypothetical protein